MRLGHGAHGNHLARLFILDAWKDDELPCGHGKGDVERLSRLDVLEDQHLGDHVGEDGDVGIAQLVLLDGVARLADRLFVDVFYEVSA